MVISHNSSTVSLFVTKLSRIFEHTQDTKEVMLGDICEKIHVLPIIYRELSVYNEIFLSVCDPKSWGSMKPCRILLSHLVIDIDSIAEEPCDTYVKAHRLYLEESENGSDAVLTYDSSTKYTMLEGSEGHFHRPCSLSTAGHWTIRSDIRYDFMLSRLWEDNVCLRPTFDVYEIDPYSEVRLDVDCYSGAQVWYPKGDRGALHGQFFD